MHKVKITAHMVVKNEDRFIYYAINSILPFIDRLLICDTGSFDQTIPVIRSIRDDKILFDSKNIQKSADITKVRQEQLDNTSTDWIWIVDGDEIYPASVAKEILKIAEIGKDLEGIVVGRYDLLGDIYHYQSESVGTYNAFGRQGHYALRLINRKNIPGLHTGGDYPYEGYYDDKNIEIIHHNRDKFLFTRGRLWHAMYLTRSTSGSILPNTLHRNKYKIESGNKLAQDIEFPQIFFGPKPNMVPGVTEKRSVFYELSASIITPIKMAKRKIQQVLV